MMWQKKSCFMMMTLLKEEASLGNEKQEQQRGVAGQWQGRGLAANGNLIPQV